MEVLELRHADARTLKLTRLCRIRLVLNLRGCSWRADLALVHVPCSSREHHPLQASLQSFKARALDSIDTERVRLGEWCALCSRAKQGG